MDSLKTIRETVAAEAVENSNPPSEKATKGATNAQSASGVNPSLMEVKPMSQLSADDIHVAIDHSRSLEE